MITLSTVTSQPNTQRWKNWFPDKTLYTFFTNLNTVEFSEFLLTWPVSHCVLYSELDESGLEEVLLPPVFHFYECIIVL